LPILKIAALIIILFAVLGVCYANTNPKLPQFLEKNQIFQSVIGRLSVSSVLEDPRFSAWKVAFLALKEKPILGWGPENFAIGFDKYYDSALPYLTKNPNEWWDRAHNIFLDLSVCNGLLFCIIYFLMFGILFYKLFKKRPENTEDKISAHAILSTFLGYFATLLFGFDSVSTYILFFFIVGYSLYLTSSGTADSTLMATRKNAENLSENQRSNQRNFSGRTFKHRKVIITALLIILIIFLWQYNLKPLFINSEINKTEQLGCEKKLSALEKLFSEKSFLDAYLRLKYVEDAKACIEIDPSKEAEYMDTSIKALKYAADFRPLYTRTWIMLGSFNTVLFANETDPQLKKNLYEEINYDFNKALSLGPKHQKILAEWAKFYFAAGDYEKMKSLSEECIALNTNTNSCYWYLGLSEIVLGDEKKGQEHLKTAIANSFTYNTQSAYSQLAIVYTQTKNYKELVPVYRALVTFDYKNVQYHATLAFVYQKLGNYKMAREEALEILKFAPDEKDAVNEFLKTLPY
jgi:tetratricopeptide (TPR) repeat protein